MVHLQMLRFCMCIVMAVLTINNVGASTISQRAEKTGTDLNSALKAVSKPCQTVVKAAWVGDMGSCINIVGLFSMATADPKKSIMPNFQSWVEGLGTSDRCARETLDDLSAKIQSKCTPRDRQETPVMLIEMVIKNYSALYQLLTVRPNTVEEDDGANYCLAKMLKAGEKKAGQPFTSAYLTDALKGQVQPLMKLALQGTQGTCDFCSTYVISTGLSVAKKYETAAGVTSLENSAKKTCNVKTLKSASAVQDQVIVGNVSSSSLQAIPIFSSVKGCALFVSLALGLMVLIC